MKVTVFGGSGFIGSHVVEQLVLAGHSVLCPVREKSNTAFLKTLPVAVVIIDFANDEDIRTAIAGSDVVCNCVADTRMHISDTERRKVEVELTTRLFKATVAAEIKRFIQLSTVMVYGFKRPPTAIDEDYPCQPYYSYSRISLEREAALLELARLNNHIETIFLRPSNTIGQRDSSFLPNFLQSHRRGLFPIVAGGHWRFSLVDTRDIGRAMAHLIALPLITSPEIFLVKGVDIDWRMLKWQLDKILDRQSQFMQMPKLPMLCVGWLLERIYPYGRNPPLTRFGIETLSNHTLFDDRKLRATGFLPKYGLAEMLKDAMSGKEFKREKSIRS